MSTVDAGEIVPAAVAVGDRDENKDGVGTLAGDKRRSPAAAALSLPPVTLDLTTNESGSTTAPIFQTSERGGRFFSFGNAAAREAAAAAQPCGGAPPRRPRVMRQNTVAGGEFASAAARTAAAIAAAGPRPREFNRGISRTYTLGSIESSIHVEEWKSVFHKLDLESDGKVDGKIPVDKFRQMLEFEPLWSETVPSELQEQIFCSADRNKDGVIDQDEFLDLVRGRYIIGFGRNRRRAFRELLKETVDLIVPYKYMYQNEYSCSPPPFFMLGISLLQVAIFAYNSAVMHKEIGYIGLNGPVPYCSHLIYNPDRRKEVWRYVTYSLIHSGLFHATFNILVQLVLGIPLEMVHGWWRVMLVYLFGVLAGSLWTSVFRPTVFLSGASGGVYALITAHLGTVIMNFREMVCPWCRILIVCVVALTDIVVYIYDMYVVGHSNPVSYPAHIAGAVTGLLVGITCLKNLRWERHERYIWAVSIFVFVLLMLVAIVWNVCFPEHFTGLAVQIGCISEHEL